MVVCPLCAKAVTYFPEEESADAAVDRHTARDCDPANYGRVHNKRRCPVPGCKERLTATNVYRCTFLANVLRPVKHGTCPVATVFKPLTHGFECFQMQCGGCTPVQSG